jgi:hypothetical protein
MNEAFRWCPRHLIALSSRDYVMALVFWAFSAFLSVGVCHLGGFGSRLGGLGGLWRGDGAGRVRRRLGDDDLRREHRSDGSDEGVFDCGVLDRGRCCDCTRVVPEGRYRRFHLAHRRFDVYRIALGSIAALVIYHGMRGLRALRGARDQDETG